MRKVYPSDRRKRVRVRREPTAADADRFWAKVQKTDGCWLWLGSRDGCGYGHLRCGVLFKATRLCLRLINGEWPRGCVCHKCDNPQCVRPDHLFVATQAENLADMRRKGRSARGSGHSMAKLNEAQVVEARRLHEAGESKRSIADRYGVSWGCIHLIVRRHNWAHVP